MTSNGCTSCGAEKIATIDGANGRRCADCPPGVNLRHLADLAADQRSPGPYLRTLLTLPPGGFRRDFAADMVDGGRADASFAYLGAYLARQIDRRFGVAIDVMAVAW